MREDEKALQPMAGTVRLILGFLLAGVVCGLYWALAGTGSLMGLGRVSVCVDEPAGAALSQTALPHQAADGVSMTGLGTRLCAAEPDAAQRIWYTLTMLPSALLLAGAMLLLWQIIRRAGRDGVHTDYTARRLRVLGWLLIIGGVLATQAESAAAVRLLRTMVTDQVGGLLMPGWPGSFWPVLLTGVGVLTFARVVRLGAGMRADLDGTV